MIHFNKFVLMKLVLLSAIVIISTHVAAQKETNWWYFGEKGALNFNKISNGLPEALDHGNLQVYESISSISDKDGSLLFYTDGSVVIDAKHDTMPNGTGLFGNRTTTQCIIVPDPGNSNKYYIFHNYYFTQSRFCFSVVDMTLRGGLGDVVAVTKNTVISTPTDKISERIAAVKMKGRKGYWVVVHNLQENNNFSNKYYAYAVTAAGVNPIPVVSKLGPIPKATPDFAGQSKFSPCGDKYATVFQSTGVIILMDFDAFTGQLSNARSNRPNGSVNGINLYGVEFSDNGSMLYTANMAAKKPNNKFFQYSTSGTTTAAFGGSLVTLTNPLVEGALGMLRGPDGKIYFIYYNKSTLGVIQDPNLKGVACTVDPYGPSFSGRDIVGWTLGLPNFVSSFHCADPNIETSKPCYGNNSNIWLSGNLEKVDSVHFNYGDVNSNSNVSSNPLDSHIYSAPGIYMITAITFSTFSGVVVSDTITKNIEIIDDPGNFLGPDTSICDGDSVLLAYNHHGVTITWNNSILVPSNYAKQAGRYYGTLSQIGCIGMDTIDIDFNAKTHVELRSDTIICEGELFLTPLDYSSEFIYAWGDGLKGYEKIVSNKGTYSLTAYGACGQDSDSINIEGCLCEIEFPNVFTPNNDGYNDHFKPINTCDISDYELAIYNRWGAKMFITNDITDTWTGDFNGQKCTPGIYF